MSKLISNKNKRIIKYGMCENNPVTFQVLGICSILAVTVKLETALIMCVALTFVLVFSSVIISCIRNLIPSKIRIIIQLTIISSLVIVADQFLKAFMFDISKQLSIFVGLIITNCIVMGRAEGFAMQNPPVKSFFDSIGNAIGYSCVLIFVAVFREVLGSGSLLGYKVIPQVLYDWGYTDCGIMVLAPGAFFLLGFVIWIQRAINGYREEQ